MVSTAASLSFAEIAAAASPSQTLVFQLYKFKDQAVVLKTIQEVESLGYRALFLAVDAVVLGNRERDVRSSWVLDTQENGIKVYNEEDSDDAGPGVGGTLISTAFCTLDFDVLAISNSDSSWRRP